MKVSLFMTERTYDSLASVPGDLSNATYQQAYTGVGTQYKGPLSNFADYDTECPTVIGDDLSLTQASLRSDYCRSLTEYGFDAEENFFEPDKGGTCLEADLCFAPLGSGDRQVWPPDAICDWSNHPSPTPFNNPNQRGVYQEGVSVFVGGADATIISFSMAYFSEVDGGYERNLYRRELQLVPGQNVYLRAKQVLRVDGNNGNKILSRRLAYSSYLAVPSLGSGHSMGHGLSAFAIEGCTEYDLQGASLINVNLDEDFDVIVVTSTFNSLTIVGACAGFLGLARAVAGVTRRPFLPI